MFVKVNSIKWFNWTGKTTVKEAILYALYWKIYWASTNLDRVINNWKDSMSVILTIEYDKQYIIERYKTANKTTSKVNWKEVDQSAIDFIFWTYEEFISKYIAGDFMKLDEWTRYSIINKLYPGDLKRFMKKWFEKI